MSPGYYVENQYGIAKPALSMQKSRENYIQPSSCALDILKLWYRLIWMLLFQADDCAGTGTS